MNSQSKASVDLSRVRRRRVALAITTALVSFDASVALAQNVNATVSETASTLNTDIVTAENIPSADIAITVNSPAVISGGTDVVLAPLAAGKGDGAISFINTGKLGALTGGTISDSVGVRLTGVGGAAAGNTASVNNSGLVTNGIQATGFGDNVSITNGGTVYGSLVGQGYGDVTVTTAPGGSIVASSPNWAAVAIASSSLSDSTTVAGVTTDTYTSGNARIDQNGNALLADGTTPANLYASSDTGNSTVNVGAKAGDVVSTAGGDATTYVSAFQAPVLSATTVTGEYGYSYGDGASTVNIAAAGSVTGVSSNGAGGGSAVTVAGKVGANGVSSTSSRTDYDDAYAVTQDAVGTTKTVHTQTSTRSGGVASVTVASTGSVGANIYAAGDAGASVVANGNVNGDIIATQQTGYNFAYSDTQTVADATEVVTETHTYAPGAASIAVGQGVTVSGDLSAYSNGDASVTAAANSIVNGNVYINARPGTNYTSTSIDVAPAPVTGDYSSSDTSTESTAGGATSFSNAGYVKGDVAVYGVTGATVTNSGQVTGSTYVETSGSTDENSSDFSHVTTTASGITTVTNTSGSSETVTGISGAITGTYSGTNGQASFSPVSAGHISQHASGNSTLTESGLVYGSLTSYAGDNTDNSQTDATTIEVTTTDGAIPANGTYSLKQTETGTSTTAAGTSTVNVTGHVSGAISSADVYSQGTTGSAVNVSGTVDGNVSSNASGIVASQHANASDFEQVTTAGVTSTTLNSETGSWSNLTTGGAASGNITGTGSVAGDLDVSGVSSATSQIGAGAHLGDSLYVSAGGTDESGTSSEVYSYDPVADSATQVNKYTHTSTAAAGSGNASANVDGRVDGRVDVRAARGNASASIQGQVLDGVDVEADSSHYSYSDEYDYAGTLSSQPLTKEIHTQSWTNTGGTASVAIDTSAAMQAQQVGSADPSVGWVYASGLGGANVTVAAGSRVGGYVEANSGSTDTTATTTTTYNTAGTSGTITGTASWTPVGHAASITNNGVIDGEASAYGLTAASVTNAGSADFLTAYSLTAGGTLTTVDNDWGNLSPSTRTITTTYVATPVGGAASVTNTGTTNGVALVGATGTLTNSGKITGDVYLGDSVENGTFVQTVTSTTTGYTVPVFTPSATLFDQTYTVNQNGAMTGDFYVSGADWYFEGDGKLYKTSNVAATINLNTGSTTTGTFYSENDTQTVVNVNGGKLTLSGDALVPVSASNGTAIWSAGLDGAATGGSFKLNVNSGTVQIVPLDYGSKTFGLNGSVTVGANGTLVVGLLNTPVVSGAGSSITGASPTVSGANLNVSGNFASTGTLVVGLNGTLVQTPQYAATTSTDFLAPITTVLGSEGTAYTTPAVVGSPVNTPSSITVGGNLSLGGKIQVYVPKGSIFTGTESQTLFTVGGTITGTPTVTSNLTSHFVTLSAVTSGQTVAVKATRVSYATAATNPNAAAAAVALDKAIPGVVKVLVDDASGIRSYSSLNQFNNIQDVANIVSNLDWNLSTAQAAEVFEELASASIYGSLANLHQNVAFEGQLDQLIQRRDGAEPAIGLWLTPVGNFAKLGGTSSGASKIDATSYGAAFGLDIAYDGNGALGFGFGYARHNVDARNFPASVDADTYSLGAYWTQGFGPLAVNAKVAYGFSTFDAHRDLALLSRKVSGHFRGNEWDGSVGLSYTLEAGGLDVVPYGELALRHWHMNAFTEEGGAGVGLAVKSASKTVFDPSVGVRVSGVADDSEGLKLLPYGSLSYTFQGDAGTARTVSYLGDPAANTFVLNGVNPKGYATVGAGLSAVVAGKVSISLGGSYAFGSDNNVAAVRSVIGIRF